MGFNVGFLIDFEGYFKLGRGEWMFFNRMEVEKFGGGGEWKLVGFSGRFRFGLFKIEIY